MRKAIGALALGVAMFVVGAALTLTIVGAPIGIPLMLLSGVPLARLVIGAQDRQAALAASDLDRWILVRDGSGVAALLRDGGPVADLGDPDRASRAVLHRAARVVSRTMGEPVSAYRLGPSLWGFRVSS
jgi:hypothetical protein